MAPASSYKAIPEFCVAIGFVENGLPVAGGICNPATEQVFIGAIDAGVLHNGAAARASQRTSLAAATGARQPQRNSAGEWRRFENSGLEIRPMAQSLTN
jgi:myo-inositol-1(or 4)-monophosphatase